MFTREDYYIGITFIIFFVIFINKVIPYLRKNYSPDLKLTALSYMDDHKMVFSIGAIACIFCIFLIAKFYIFYTTPPSPPSGGQTKVDGETPPIPISPSSYTKQHQNGGIQSTTYLLPISKEDIEAASNTTSPNNLSTYVQQGGTYDYSKEKDMD